MRTSLAAIAVVLAMSTVSHAEDWRVRLRTELPRLGHRNWIVVADSAYPAQSRPGVETVVTEADHLDVLRIVLDQLERSRHVRPVVHLDAELKHVPEQHARGIGALRDQLARALEKHDVKAVPHEELIARLDRAGETFRVLVLKTNLALPYTSVFLQLDCRYWSDEAEKQLREAMKTPKDP